MEILVWQMRWRVDSAIENSKDDDYDVWLWSHSRWVKTQKLQSDVKEYVLVLAEVRKILSEEDLGEVTRKNLMKEKAHMIETIDEQSNERGKQEKK